jgi:hypothetical protein
VRLLIFTSSALKLTTAISAGNSYRAAVMPSSHLTSQIPLGRDSGGDRLVVDASARRLNVTHVCQVAVLSFEFGKTAIMSRTQPARMKSPWFPTGNAPCHIIG